MARVLIAEPVLDLRLLAEQAVLELGHEPVLLENHVRGERVDLLLLATFDGMTAVVDDLGPQRRSVPIICLGTLPASDQARSLRPLAYLVKPYTLDELQRALDRALEGVGER